MPSQDPDKPHIELSDKDPDEENAIKDKDKAASIGDTNPISDKNRSLYLFSSDNKFRILMKKIERSNYFKNGILLLIIATSITLAVESPLKDPESTEVKVLSKIDLVTTIIFTIEVLIKVIANGFLLNGRKSYLRKSWNILDFFIVIVALL